MAETSVDLSGKMPGWSVDMVDNSALAEIPAHILLVDDDPSILIALASLLEGPGRTVLTANTGQSALRYLLRHDCAVIVLDVRMPQMDGFELAGLIRQRDRSRFTPIIFLSGVDTMDADVVRGLSSGAVDYLVKPVPPDILRHKVDVFVELFQLREWANKQARKQSEERFRLLVEGIEDYAIVLLDLDGKVATWNRGGERLTGYVSEEILGQPYACFYPPEEVTLRLPDDDLKQAIEVVTGQAVRADIDRQLVKKDGSRFIATVMVTALRDERKALQAYAVVIRDVTERKRAEQALRESEGRLRELATHLERRVEERTAELHQSQERLRALATELSLSEQRERKRLATELHDHLQQILVLGKLKLGQGKRHAEAVPEAAKLMKETDDVLSDALKYTRTLVAELSPIVLRDHGLSAGLKWLGEYMHKHQIAVTVIVPEDELTLPEEHAVLLFQSVRELLINSAKHAGTGQATVALEQRDGLLRIDVRDEGAGFDPADAAAGTPGGGISSKYGLFSIQEHMRALGGSFDIQSSPGKGTTATLMLPLATRTELSESDGSALNAQHSALPGRSALSAQHSALQQHTNRVRVLLVDDHAMVRQGLRSVLDAYKDIQVVGEAHDGAEAVRLVDELQPQVVVMDINMPKMNGIEATTHIKAHWPETIVVGISVNTGDDNGNAMRGAGAAVLLNKDAAVDDLYRTIQDVLKTNV